LGFIDTRSARRFSAEKLQKINLFETPQMFCDVYCLEPGQAQKPHRHEGSTKFYFVLEGEGEFSVAGQSRRLRPGEMAAAGPGEEHGVLNDSSGRLVLLVASTKS
jgi:quercetin dioxygenase-like cupin family protein